MHALMHMRARMHALVHVHACMHMCACTCARVHMHGCTCAGAHAWVHMHGCTCAGAHAWVRDLGAISCLPPRGRRCRRQCSTGQSSATACVSPAVSGRGEAAGGPGAAAALARSTGRPLSRSRSQRSARAAASCDRCLRRTACVERNGGPIKDQRRDERGVRAKLLTYYLLT